MKKRAVIFGTGSLAESVDFYLTHDSDYVVEAFTATGDAAQQGQYRDRPVVPFETVESRFSPAEYEMFVAVGFAQLNRLRERFCREARAKGYRLLTYISSKATHWGATRIGDNVLVLEDNTIQPFVGIGDGSFLWSGNHVGHQAVIGSYCFIASHVVISGHCRIGDRSFIGVNATISDDVVIGRDNLVGAASLIEKNTGDGEVYLAERTKKFPKDSSRFFKF